MRDITPGRTKPRLQNRLRGYGPRLAAYALIAILATCTVAGQHVTTMSVSTTIHDVDISGAALLTRSDDYNGFQQAVYTNTGNVTSVIYTSGNPIWELFLGNQSLRTISLTFSPAAGSPPAPVSNGSYSRDTEVYSHCYNTANQDTGFLQIAPGTSNNRCSLGVDFSSGHLKYRLVMNPVNYAGTGWASVSCNTANGTVCSSWTIIPNTADATYARIAYLFQFTNKGLVYLGSYSNTYRIDITSP